jgi:putative transposase
LTVRDLAEMFLERGFRFTHEAVRDWEERFAPLVTQKLRVKRKGRAGVSWYVDETYIKVKGRWCYLYRAIDKDGNLVDSMLSQKRDLKSAKRFFKRALRIVSHSPDRVTTDGYDVYPKAIKCECGGKTAHRTNHYLNNGIEQDHRGIKQRYRSMRGFKCFRAASRFCTAYDELRNYLRPRERMRETPSLIDQRTLFLERWSDLMTMLETA